MIKNFRNKYIFVENFCFQENVKYLWKIKFYQWNNENFDEMWKKLWMVCHFRRNYIFVKKPYFHTNMKNLKYIIEKMLIIKRKFYNNKNIIE